MIELLVHVLAIVILFCAFLVAAMLTLVICAWLLQKARRFLNDYEKLKEKK